VIVLSYSLGSWIALYAGGEALDALARERFDVTIMDVQMPDIDGLEVTRIVRDRESRGVDGSRNGRMPIIAVTAHAMSGDRERCLDAGMDGYLSKPIDHATLTQEIRRVVAP
jgi:CheY-like chemotaxis protein